MSDIDFFTYLSAICPPSIDLFSRHLRQEAKIFLFQLPPPYTERSGDLCERRLDSIVDAASK